MKIMLAVTVLALSFLVSGIAEANSCSSYGTSLYNDYSVYGNNYTFAYSPYIGVKAAGSATGNAYVILANYSNGNTEAGHQTARNLVYPYAVAYGASTLWTLKYYGPYTQAIPYSLITLGAQSMTNCSAY